MFGTNWNNCPHHISCGQSSAEIRSDIERLYSLHRKINDRVQNSELKVKAVETTMKELLATIARDLDRHDKTISAMRIELSKQIEQANQNLADHMKAEEESLMRAEKNRLVDRRWNITTTFTVIGILITALTLLVTIK